MNKKSSQAPTDATKTHNANISKLVSSSHGVVVEQTGGGDPAWVCVICKDYELVFIALVTDPEQTLLDVRNDHSLANGVDSSHQVWNVL